ncbi:MAG TPA: VWA domain-containing protein [Thermoanaerobaculia bacterium]|nr:VWA domain-containing protein [Thermoanaerobaculia bacterium]
MLLAALFTAVTAHAGVTFVAPQPGAQAIGAQLLEVTTDAEDVDRVEFYVDGVLAGVARAAPYRIAFDFGTALEPRTVTARVFSGGYRTTRSAEIVTAALTAGESMNVDLVEVPMRVHASRAIRPEDIRLRENSVDQAIRQILPGRGPAQFAFVVDRSLSMTGGKLDAALDAVDRATALLRSGDTASLIVFNHHVSRAQPLRADAGAASTLAATVPSGGTSLRDAVAASIRSGASRTYVVVITDGGDRNSLLSEEDALRQISGTKTVVSAVVLGRPGSFLDQATGNTGGLLLRATEANVRRQVQHILEDINGRYTLVYQSSGTAPGWRTISIAPRRSGVKIVSARTGYFAE